MSRLAYAVLVATGLAVGAVPAAADDTPKAPPPPPAAAGTAPDAIDEALALDGLTRSDLGWRARGWWDRYPQHIPYKLRHVDDLFEQPLATVPWLRAMGAQARELLGAEGLAAKGPQGGGALYRLVHDLGVSRRYGAMRSYSANLGAAPMALAAALQLAWHDAKRPTALQSFGKPADWPRIEQDLAKAVAPLPQDVNEILGTLVRDLLDAQAWVDLAWRNVPLETRAAIHRRLDIGIEETDALDFAPAFDDAARTWDEASLWYGGLKVVEALDVARKALVDPVAKFKDDLRSFHLDVATPRGRVVVLGTGDDTLDVGTEGAFLVVDLGGNDHYLGSVAASNPMLPVGALLDLSGDDLYEAKDRAQGAGSVGVGVLLDAAGNDRYRLKGTLGQGAGLFGLGVLADLAGTDVYEAQYSAQGCGFFGVGMLLDAAGNDAYTVWSDGQGFGGVAGVGVLVDRAGNDAYEAVVDPAVTGRPSYHTGGKVTVSNAQGCGMGRRGDGSDGHSWAGGMGCLLDVEGKDTYTAANWCQGCGYWFGTGFLWDGAGDDEYRANGWASGSGAHFCIGCLVDEGGDDLHHVTQDWGPGYGHDFTVGICCDLGGNDRYECGASGFGWSINRSVALLIDVGGADSFAFTEPDRHPGTAVFDARFLDRKGLSPLYWTEPTSVGLFLHVGKDAKYPPTFGVGRTLTDPPASDNVRARNFGIAVDRAEGTVDLERPASRSER